MEVHRTKVEGFRSALLRWYLAHGRDYPWRRVRTPYRTAMAELMLRRTRANQVVPVYEAFMEAYPSLADAARENPEAIRHMLRPLGLEWRAQNTVDFVREAHTRYGDDLPAETQAVRKLPGAGDYVSAAVACFAGGKPEALIDTNVVRVIGRVFGLATHGEARRRKELREAASLAMDPEHPADYHYALLDLAASICTPRKPRCDDCPIGSARLCCHALVMRLDASEKLPSG